MPNTDKDFKRWYDEDDLVSECVQTLEGIEDSYKRQTATFLMDEILTKPPFVDMMPNEIFSLITSEDRKRRWYDFDEVMRIFLELLRYSCDETRMQISKKAIKFVETLNFEKRKNIE